MPSFLSAPHSWNGHYRRALRLRWKRSDVVWCFLCCSGNKPQIPAPAECRPFLLFAPEGDLDLVKSQPVRHRLLVYASQNRCKGEIFKGTHHAATQIIYSSVKDAFIGNKMLLILSHHSAQCLENVFLFFNTASPAAFGFQQKQWY